MVMRFENDEERKAMLAAIIDSSEDAIVSKDLNSRITSWNKAAERMFGYTEQEIVGQLVHILIPEDRRSEEDVIIASLKRGERVEHFETIRRTKDGHFLDISLTVSPIKDTRGVIIGASKIARDITRQKQAEERLRIINEVGQRVSAELDIDNILQIVTDATTKLSEAAYGAFFYNKIDAQGETYMLYALTGASRADFDKFGMPRNTAVFATTFDGTGVLRSDDITKDPRYGKNRPYNGMPEGHLPVVSYLAVPVRSQSGTVIGGLFFGHSEPGKFTRDHELLVTSISTQAAIALDNAKLYQEITALNSKKDDFIGFASHELKTPVTTIKGYLQLGNANNMAVAEVYPKVCKQLERLETLIDDLLDISRIQAGKQEYVYKKVKLSELISESVDSLNLADHQLVIDTPPGEIMINVDRQKMTQVMVNLLSNAEKYSPKGTKIEIHAQVLGSNLQLSVRDQGSGIPASELTRIFNQFYRTPHNSSSAKGMGLGLYIAKEIVDAHFGKIWVESEVGKGSTFHISIPIERAKGH
jgi:PAS domain S-box-containing protein